jgi:hypothetical protein
MAAISAGRTRIACATRRTGGAPHDRRIPADVMKEVLYISRESMAGATRLRKRQTRPDAPGRRSKVHTFG